MAEKNSQEKEEKEIQEDARKLVTTGQHKGVCFYNIAPLLLDPQVLKNLCMIIGNWAKGLKNKVKVVVGLDARGFIFGPIIALQLDLGFAIIRKKGKLPPPTISLKYKKEYGEDEIEINQDSIPNGASTLIIDDLLATGGTAEAAAKLVEQAGGVVSGFGFVIDLPDAGGNARLKAAFPDASLYAPLAYDEGGNPIL
eukprot:CAMPEP_0201491058 /NCGR_PEP_ID=MMETSP0151_2-20130828/28473_1 /ASSEMBLY_ACC=CAM_ASM_000257 /TAXON_ID=200890 /ORGANISM="Paramoeba atlantica, Strain 621/1 / CCAP 1560/9" /LENGTH=196 /DNA_ID=CAMNT_0047877259 /DNA_START=23 /DNA_END=613 /DNA_ORIENTATION=+